jgi:predicted DnaQ family exonuclease/DinG family helicase
MGILYMNRTFSIIEWHQSPSSDLHCVRFNSEGSEAPSAIIDRGGLLNESFVLCFRPEELMGDWRDAWHYLVDQGRALDAGLVARIVMPAIESHTLARLAQELGISYEPESGRESAAIAGAVMRDLLLRLLGLPIAILIEMEELLKPTRHSLRELVDAAVKVAVKQGFGAKGRNLADLLPKELTPAHTKRRTPALEPPLPLDVEYITGLFSPEGKIANAREEYEYRPEQVRMVHEVADAFNDSTILMVEAGTGTGKSMAYLTPAVIWAVQNEDPVIISTNTKNLQGQLFKKDLPLLAEALGGGFRYALIKGRANYLCIRKLMMLLRDADQELSEEDRIDLLPILTWFPETEVGDVAENAGFKPGMESPLWNLISTRMDECVGQSCRHYGRCFVRRARATAAQCDVIVANHATVFFDLGMPGPVLPEHRTIVFDEAHNLEDVATTCFATVIAPWRVPRIMNRLYRSGRRGAGKGLFASLRFQLSKVGGAFPGEVVQRMGEWVERCIAHFAEVQLTGDRTFDAIDALFAASRRRMDRIRYDADNRPEEWYGVAQNISDYSSAIGQIVELGDRISQEAQSSCSASDDKGKLQDMTEVAAEIGAQAMLLRGVMQDIDILLKGDDENRVYWVERGRRPGDGSLSAAPLDIAELMNEHIYSQRRTVIMTSATMTAGRSFNFMRDRLGLRGPVSERTHTVDLGSSYDFDEQAFAAVPVFLPEPRAYGPDFVTPFSELAIDILRTTQGRGLVLFTSHAMLRQAHQIIEPALSMEGIRVLAQGIDGAREQIMARFANETSSVLLGTQSFWEGVDIPGESLSCLIMAKLPFRPHTDPIISARCERLKEMGHNDFSEYMVPDAAIRMKQGFGRLIRSRRDRGIVVICDPRIATKGYGRAFRDSLPTRVRVFAKAGQLLTGLEEFLASDSGVH